MMVGARHRPFGVTYRNIGNYMGESQSRETSLDGVQGKPTRKQLFLG